MGKRELKTTKRKNKQLLVTLPSINEIFTREIVLTKRVNSPARDRTVIFFYFEGPYRYFIYYFYYTLRSVNVWSVSLETNSKPCFTQFYWYILDRCILRNQIKMIGILMLIIKQFELLSISSFNTVFLFEFDLKINKHPLATILNWRIYCRTWQNHMLGSVAESR